MEYEIRFITLDSHKQTVIIYARNEAEAERKFERNYDYYEIIEISTLNN